ncbi:MAG: NUDIX hydrolase [Candidatus Aenigmatarchaeota archaeon]|nr:MAG: NUDIX hydrolase [Candidatus Aenigmarchaeota archaeon]
MPTEMSACVLVEKDGKILLVKRKNKTFFGYWCLPGGHAEPGETPKKAAQREANEEVGQVEVEGEPVMVFKHDWPADSHIPEPHIHHAHCFRASVRGEIRAGSDAAELGWFSPREAMEMKITGYTWIVLDHMF